MHSYRVPSSNVTAKSSFSYECQTYGSSSSARNTGTLLDLAQPSSMTSPVSMMVTVMHVSAAWWAWVLPEGVSRSRRGGAARQPREVPLGCPVAAASSSGPQPLSNSQSHGRSAVPRQAASQLSRLGADRGGLRPTVESVKSWRRHVVSRRRRRVRPHRGSLRAKQVSR